MYPWMNPWLYMFKTPWSGDLSQDIAPVTTWFSPQLEFNFAGNKKIEADIVAEVASYGRQLGILSDAVLELAEGKAGQSVEDLRKLMGDIDKIKRRHEESLEVKAKLILDELKNKHPDVLKQLIREYSEKK